MILGQTLVADLPLPQIACDHAGHVTASLEQDISDDAHQSDAAAAVDQVQPTRGEGFGQAGGGLLVGPAFSFTGPAVNADFSK